jgi:uncharacterized protein YjbI with pentapeptide repeats
LRKADLSVEEQPMADKTQLAMLKSGVNEWNVWRTAHADLHPDLSDAHLHGLDLIGANLAGADLRKADLRGANLSDASLTGARLEGATFFKAVLDRADISGANLVGAQFLTKDQLVTARNWQSAYRDLNLACGASVPPLPSRH